MAQLEEHCMYFVKRKMRYCRMTLKKGNKYCGEHLHNSVEFNKVEENNVNRKRITCPLDPTHTCFESKLSKHLTVCNAKRLLDKKDIFIVKGINVDNGMEEVPLRTPLSQLNPDLVKEVIKKINVVYESLPEIPKIILSHAVLKDKLNDSSCGKNIRRHLLQDASLLAHLERAGLMQNNTCFIEFGAGKGNLTYWLAQMIKDKKDSCILLVDRASHRHKSDNKLKKEQHEVLVKRIRADIADLQLNNVMEIQQFKYKVGVAKHLCGAATDLSIRCLIQSQQDCKPNVNGLVIAFCCHHKCDYISYVGKKYLEQCGFVPKEFSILCSIASWATCGINSKNIVEPSTQNLHNDERMDTSEREQIGKKVKAILNWGRLEFLKDLGFKSHLYYYTSPSISLENMCIVAIRATIL